MVPATTPRGASSRAESDPPHVGTVALRRPRTSTASGPPWATPTLTYMGQSYGTSARGHLRRHVPDPRPGHGPRQRRGPRRSPPTRWCSAPGRRLRERSWEAFSGWCAGSALVPVVAPGGRPETAAVLFLLTSSTAPAASPCRRGPGRPPGPDSSTTPCSTACTRVRDWPRLGPRPWPRRPCGDGIGGARQSLGLKRGQRLVERRRGRGRRSAVSTTRCPYLPRRVPSAWPAADGAVRAGLRTAAGLGPGRSAPCGRSHSDPHPGPDTRLRGRRPIVVVGDDRSTRRPRTRGPCRGGPRARSGCRCSPRTGTTTWPTSTVACVRDDVQSYLVSGATPGTGRGLHHVTSGSPP